MAGAVFRFQVFVLCHLETEPQSLTRNIWHSVLSPIVFFSYQQH